MEGLQADVDLHDVSESKRSDSVISVATKTDLQVVWKTPEVNQEKCVR